MSTKVKTCNADNNLQNIAQNLVSQNISSVLVTNETGDTIGIVTKSDIMEFISQVDSENGLLETPAQEIMNENFETIQADSHLTAAADKMITKQVHHLPVETEEEGIIGMISTTDLATYISPILEPTPE